jgi:hypothetical protein
MRMFQSTKIKYLYVILSASIAIVPFRISAMNANPIFSLNKPVFGSALNNASQLVNGKFGESAWIVQNNSWAAINVGAGPSKVFVCWNCTNYMWSDSIAAPSCPQNRSVPASYAILVSSNSTNGSDGTWSTAVSVAGNIVSARGHLIDFSGVSWVKMTISSGGGQIDEIQIFDASKGSDDSWFFCGTSISANAFKGSNPSSNFADLIAAAHPGFSPAFIMGGIGCIKSTDCANDIPKYLTNAGNVHFWAIEMGTNDAWGGSNYNAPAFKNNLQRVIDSCKAHGIVPVIARMIATDSAKAGWQVHPDFLQAIDDLATKNNLQNGPDLFTWFKSHPSHLNSDGVHPNDSGARDIQRLWAEKADPFYAVSETQRTDLMPVCTSLFTASSMHGYLRLTSPFDAIVSIVSINGRLFKETRLNAGGEVFMTAPKGVYCLRAISKGKCAVALVRQP